MRVLQIPVNGTWTVYAACSERGDCPLLDFFEEHENQLQANIEGVYALLQHVAVNGPPRNANLCHQLRGDIWEFRKGRIRILYFCHGGKVVVCTHALVKSTRAIRNAEIERAESVLNEYREAVANNSLQIDQEMENGE